MAATTTIITTIAEQMPKRVLAVLALLPITGALAQPQPRYQAPPVVLPYGQLQPWVPPALPPVLPPVPPLPPLVLPLPPLLEPLPLPPAPCCGTTR